MLPSVAAARAALNAFDSSLPVAPPASGIDWADSAVLEETRAALIDRFVTGDWGAAGGGGGVAAGGGEEDMGGFEDLETGQVVGSMGAADGSEDGDGDEEDEEGEGDGLTEQEREREAQRQKKLATKARPNLNPNPNPNQVLLPRDAPQPAAPWHEPASLT